ncbi:NAD(+) diphosphatase [Pararhodobacter oceanensis]|uniref:NAD(+) diphosphatase n=1 Tax=Pararhodobacter oceanensis TaxID=2172121 RepID=UPI003A8D404F
MTVQREIVFSAEWDGRRAELRRDSASIEALQAEPGTLVLPLWRGRPLVDGDAREGLAWLAPDHPVLRHARDAWIYLGDHAGHARFAADVSSWVPVELDTAAFGGFIDPTEYQHPDLPEGQVFAELRGLMVTLEAADAALASTARGLMNWHRSHRFCSSCGQPSVVAQSGWQRLCPACNASHFPRTDPVVIMLVLRGNRVLLGRSPHWPEGMYSALAGFVEPGETLETAVRREVFEETGVRCGEVRYVAGQPWSWPNSLMLGFVTEAQDEAITLDPVELEDARWLTREEMVDVMAGVHPDVRRPRAGAIAYELVMRWLAGTIR